MFRFHFDWLIVLPSILLLALGLSVIQSIAPGLFAAQLGFILFSVLIFIIISSLDYEIIFSLHLIGYLVSLLLLISLPFIGVLSRGATRWIPIGNFTLQPSELIKPFLLLTLSYFSSGQFARKNLWVAVFGLIPVLLIFIQPDLGTSIVLLVGWASIILSQVKIRTLAILLLVGLGLTFPVYKYVLQDYQRQRLTTYINPYSDPLGDGYHIIQSMIAVGSGQALGRGLGHGTQTQLRFLPEHHTDFIFSSVSEELGFVGATLTIILYVALLYRIFRISQTTTDPKSALFSISALAMLGFQIFINVGMNVGLAPITGITLPLLSTGGSSILSTAMILGIVSSISRTSRSVQAITIH